MAEVKVVEVTVPKSGSYEIGQTIQEYTDACKKAFASVRKLKKLGIGQPWVDIWYESQTGPEFGPNLYDEVNGTPINTKWACRIRLEVR